MNSETPRPDPTGHAPDQAQATESGQAATVGPETEGSPERLAQQLEEANNRTLRAQAELENVRRRLRREMEDDRRYAPQPLLVDLLPVMDNIERAIAAAESSPDASGLLAGFRMVAQQMESVFEKHQCREVPAAGQPFDPQLHEALSQVPSADHPAHTVLHVHQKGYQLHDRVIRPAQVVVSTAASGSEAS